MNGDDVAKWLFDKDQVNLEDGSEEPGRLNANEEISLLDWETLFPASRPKPQNQILEQNRKRYQQMLHESPEDWHDTWKDPWVGELNGNVIERIIGGIGSSRDRRKDAEESPWDWDTAAWYQSIHFFGYDWGIYIKEDALIRQARYIGTFLPVALKKRVPPEILAKALIRASLASYFLHEQYHHKVECLGIRLYVVEKQPRYIPYWKKVYHPSLGKDELLEEALANADAYLRLSDSPYSVWLPKDLKKSAKDALKYSFEIAPPGYRRAKHYFGKDFDSGENRLHGMVQEANLKPTRTANDWNFAPRLMQSFFKVNDGIWTVVPTGTRSILPTKVAPVKVGSSNDIVKLLEKVGYFIVPGEGKGSHIKLKKTGSKTVIVPGNRKNISPGVGKNIATAIGLKGLGELQIALNGTVPIENLMQLN